MFNRIKRSIVRVPGIREVYRWWRAGRPYHFSLGGVTVQLRDLSRSPTTAGIMEEVAREYGLADIELRPGDVVIDIGAHVGAVSVYLAKRHPYATVYAYEPVPSNFASLSRNIAANGLTNLHAFNLAVTSDGREVKMDTNLRENSGGSGFARGEGGGTVYTVQSITFDGVLEAHRIERCNLLKIDCEGAEHEILRASRNLHRVDDRLAEFHEDDYYRAQGHTVKALEEHCRRFIAPERMRIVPYIG